ncbi:MAG: TerD family protein [Firmicutes bacterium]|jgi:stress response protein SCP2|nr:TerD family protein [Bacillota bacterium]
MSVNLQKGQKVDLTKGNAGLKRLIVGLGWDEAEKKVGFFGRKKGADIDCDASALVCGAGGKLLDKDDIVYFGNLKHRTGAITHLGDNLTGEGEGDDEQLIVELNAIPESYEKIIFVVNIYKAFERNQHFGMIKNAFIRIVDADTKQELCKYNLSENYNNMTAMIFGEVYRYKGEWKFNAIGQPTQDKGLGELAARFL